tara:strand:+ start:1384 stop:2109 length:726 start_codon:yes stop_codon:yes gene_type:complete
LAIEHHIYRNGHVAYTIPYTNKTGIKFSLKANSRLVQKRASQLYEREPLTIEWITSFDKGSVFVDVGANIGSYSLLAAKTRKTTTYAFEPHPLNFAELCTNIYLNNLKNITPYPIALTDSSKFDTFNISQMIPGAADNSFAENSRLGESISLGCYGTKLDNLFIEGVIEQPDYIKIDVDGAELNVLYGASIVLQNAKEVQVELRKKNADQAEEFLGKLGYSIDYDASYRLNEYEINYVFKR